MIGGTTKLVGKAVGTKFKGTGEWIEEIGDSVQSASKNALENAGQLVDGTVQSTYGAIKKDEYDKQQGIHDLKDLQEEQLKELALLSNILQITLALPIKA